MSIKKDRPCSDSTEHGARQSAPSNPKQASQQDRRASREIRKGLRQQLRESHRKLATVEQRNTALRGMLAKREAGEEIGGVRSENIVWVFGSGRTGSSWLTFMMGALPNHTRWNEPQVGYLFGHLYYERYEERQCQMHFILDNEYRDTWLSCARKLVLEGATARFPERAEGGYLVIKEPHGALGAPLLMEALPESRMILLVRDPRDVVASALDAHKKGSRPSERRIKHGKIDLETTADQQPDVFVQERAAMYLQHLQITKRAYKAHEGRKVLVRYEDLRADTLSTMKRIYSALEIPVEEGDLSWVVERFSWENIPEEEKGEGKMRRKATPGSWSGDLTPEQVEIVEREAADVLKEFYA